MTDDEKKGLTDMIAILCQALEICERDLFLEWEPAGRELVRRGAARRDPVRVRKIAKIALDTAEQFQHYERLGDKLDHG
jgi:hypothetical protein